MFKTSKEKPQTDLQLLKIFYYSSVFSSSWPNENVYMSHPLSIFLFIKQNSHIKTLLPG